MKCSLNASSGTFALKLRVTYYGLPDPARGDLMPIFSHKTLFPALLVFLAACSTTQPVPEPPATSQEIPAEIYLNAAATSAVYQVVPERSRAEILVHRAGRLQRLGHDHVILAPGIAGYALLDAERPQASRADLAIDLNALMVDAPELRAVYQLETHPSESDIQGTTKNMSEHVLQTATWPEAFVQVMGIESLEGETRCTASLTLKGTTKSFPTTIIVHRDEDVLSVRGSFDLNQSDYGIKPFSVLGGALSVQDRVEISYRLEATRMR